MARHDASGLLLGVEFCDKSSVCVLTVALFIVDPGDPSHFKTTQIQTRFITQFHAQHKKMKSIFKSHWNILLEDPLLKPSLSTVPKIKYRKPKNIKSRIAPSKLKTAKTKTTPSLTFLSIKDMYQCKKLQCLTCSFVTHHQKSFTTKGKTYSLNDFYNCCSEFVVYCVTCPCGLLYVGCTIRTLHKRFREHKRSI